MNTTVQQKQKTIREFLKRQLKFKKLNYKKVAVSLGVSEITVKKWMTVRNLKVETLIQLGALIDVDFFDLLNQDPTKLPDFKFYSLDQDKYFSTHPIDWVVFIKIRHRIAPVQIQHELNISASEFQRATSRLEKNGLLERWPQGKVKMKAKGPFTLRRDGQMFKTLFGELRNHMFMHFKKKFPPLTPLRDPAASTMFRAFEFFLTDESRKDYVQELMRMIAKYLQIAESELNQNLNVSPVCSVIGVDQYEGWLNTTIEKMALKKS